MVTGFDCFDFVLCWTFWVDGWSTWKLTSDRSPTATIDRRPDRHHADPNAQRNDRSTTAVEREPRYRKSERFHTRYIQHRTVRYNHNTTVNFRR